MRVAGLDLGKRGDFSAVAVLDITPPVWTLDYAARLRQGTYHQQVAEARPILSMADLIAVDASGVGDAVVELMSGLPIAEVVIVAGKTAPQRNKAGRIVVGKMALIGVLMAAMAKGQLRMAPHAAGRAELRQELERFIIKPPRPGGRLPRLEASEGHDDLVLAAALVVLAAQLHVVGRIGATVN